MKSFLPALTLLLAAGSAVFAQTSNGVPLPGRLTVENRDFFSDPLLNSTQSYYFYNPDSTLNHEVEEAWNETTNAWEHNRQFFSGYGPDRRIVEWLGQQIQFNGTWVNRFRTLYTYYPDPAYLDGAAKTGLNQDWDAATQQWDTSYIQTTTAFGPGTGALEGEIAQNTYEGFFSGEKAYGGASNYFRVATPGGVRLEHAEYLRYNSATGIDEYSSKDVYVYNSPASLTYDTLYEYPWVEASGSWAAAPIYRTIRTVSGNQTVELNQLNDIGGWKNLGRVITVTDNNDLFLSYVSEDWQDSSASFTTNYKVDYTYNPDRSIDVITVQNTDFFDPTLGLFLSQRLTYEYGTNFVGAHTPAFQAGVKVFPNPTSGFVQVSMENASAQDVKYSVLDTKGKLLLTTRTSGNTASFSLAGQPAGIYLLRVEQGDAVKVIPVVKN